MRRLAVPCAILAMGVSTASAQIADTTKVRLGDASHRVMAFEAWPIGKGPFPAVVVIHEWWGLNSQMRDLARRLAREGYAAVVPDLYHGQVAADAEEAHVLSRGLDSKRALAELKAAVATLRTDTRIGQKKIAVIGFCMGGGLALDLGLESAEFAAIVMFYGDPVTDPSRLASLGAALQAHFGQTDKGIPGTEVDAFRQALRKAGKPGEVFVYAGAGHAFMNDERPSFHPDAARQAWARTLAFLQKHVKK